MLLAEPKPPKMLNTHSTLPFYVQPLAGRERAPTQTPTLKLMACRSP